MLTPSVFAPLTVPLNWCVTIAADAPVGATMTGPHPTTATAAAATRTNLR